MLRIGRVVLLVQDYDEAIEFYSEVLNFQVLMDFQEDDYRFVHIAPPNQKDVGIWLIKANLDLKHKVGQHTANEPFLVLYTDNFEIVYNQIKEKKAEIKIHPFETPQGKVMHFLDLYGNEIVLVEHR